METGLDQSLHGNSKMRFPFQALIKSSSYKQNMEITVPTKTIQIISTLKYKATNAAATSEIRGPSHGIFDANRKVTVSRRPTKEHSGNGSIKSFEVGGDESRTPMTAGRNKVIELLRTLLR